MSALSFLFTKLVNIGLFPPTPPVARSQPSFFQATLTHIRTRLNKTSSSQYSVIWASIFLNIAGIPLQSILTSLYGSLKTIERPLEETASVRASIKREAVLLEGLVGRITPDAFDQADLWEISTSLMLSRSWHESAARVFVCWISGSSRGRQINLKGRRPFTIYNKMIADITVEVKP